MVSIFRRRMHHLAAKFVGSGGIHVVDPNVDLRYLFEKEADLKRSLEERRLLETDLPALRKDYERWFLLYKKWAKAEKGETASTAKKELREAKEGLLAALALPNFVQAIGSEEKPMLKATKHFEYLCSNGLMRIDRENALVHLVGYPVLLQQEIRNRLSSLFADAQLVSPSSFVRPAVLQGVNVDLSDFPAFSYGSPGAADMYLVGHSLPALLAPFIRTDFTEKNSWPILLQSSGMAYRPKRANPNLTCARQRLKHCLLSLASSSEQIDTFLATAISKIAGFLNEELELDVKGRLVMGKELRNYESQAVVFEEKGLELARISRADDYISRRLNIRYDDDEFVQMLYLETDIDRVIARLFDNLIDGCERPRLLRKLMKK